MKIRLRVNASPTKAYQWEHPGARARIGRDPTCHLSFPDDDEVSQVVSWQHADIELSPRGAFLTDLNSTNGTFVNGTRVAPRTKVSEGDQIRLGKAGPCLEVLALDLAAPPTVGRSVERNAGPITAGNLPNSGALSDPFGPASSAAMQSANLSHAVGALASNTASDIKPDPSSGSTRAMLVEMQRQHRRLFWILSALGIVGLVAVVGGLVLFNRNMPQIVVADPEAAVGPAAPMPATPQPANIQHLGEPTPVPSTRKDEKLASKADQSTPAPDWKRVVASYEDSLVWLGFKTKSGFRIPYFAGFVVGPDRVATTASAVNYLREYQKPDNGIVAFVYCQRHPDRPMQIKEFRPHVKFNPQDPGSPDSINYNVGVVILEGSLSVEPCVVSRADDVVQRIRNGLPVLAAGFNITDELRRNDFDQVNPPEIVRSPGTVGRASVGGSASIIARRSLSLDAAEGQSGSPVFDRDGKVVMVLWVNQGSFGVVASSLEDILK